MGRPTIGQLANIWRVGIHEGHGRGRVRSRAKPEVCVSGPGFALGVRWGGPCPFGQRTAPPYVTAWGTLPLRSKNHLAPGVMTLRDKYASSCPAGALVR